MRLIHILLLFLFLTAGVRALELRESDGAIEVYSGEKLLIRYHKASPKLPDGVSDVYRRSGFIHPIATPDGRVLTDAFPHDHLHQHGLFMAWTSGKYDGKKIDFWNQKKEEGRVEHRRVLAMAEIGDAIAFMVELAHFDQREGGKEILREVWSVKAFPVEGDSYRFDIESRQTLVGETPLEVEKYHYGGMALRGAAAWLGTKEKPGCEFLTSEGKKRKDGNHTRPNWVAMKGELEGKPATIAVLGHPENFRAPQSVRIHPDKPYFSFSPMVEEGFLIEAGEPYVSRYSYVVSDDDLDTEAIEGHWQAYFKK